MRDVFPPSIIPPCSAFELVVEELGSSLESESPWECCMPLLRRWLIMLPCGKGWLVFGNHSGPTTPCAAAALPSARSAPRADCRLPFSNLASIALPDPAAELGAVEALEWNVNCDAPWALTATPVGLVLLLSGAEPVLIVAAGGPDGNANWKKLPARSGSISASIGI